MLQAGKRDWYGERISYLVCRCMKSLLSKQKSKSSYPTEKIQFFGFPLFSFLVPSVVVSGKHGQRHVAARGLIGLRDRRNASITQWG